MALPSDTPSPLQAQAADRFANQRMAQMVRAGLLAAVPHTADPAAAWRQMSAGFASHPDQLQEFLAAGHSPQLASEHGAGAGAATPAIAPATTSAAAPLNVHLPATLLAGPSAIGDALHGNPGGAPVHPAFQAAAQVIAHLQTLAQQVASRAHQIADTDYQRGL